VYVSSIVAEHTNIETRRQSEKHFRQFHDMTRPTFHTWRDLTRFIFWFIELTCPGPSYWCPLLAAVVENCLTACTAFEPSMLENCLWFYKMYGKSNRRRKEKEKPHDTNPTKYNKVIYYLIKVDCYAVGHCRVPVRVSSLSVFNSDNRICVPRVVIDSYLPPYATWDDVPMRYFCFQMVYCVFFCFFLFWYSLVKCIIKMINKKNNKVLIDIVNITKLTLVNLLFIIMTPFLWYFLFFTYEFIFLLFFFID